MSGRGGADASRDVEGAGNAGAPRREAPAAPPAVEGLSALAPRYDLAICDVWGVLHDGLSIFPEAADALLRFRAGGVAAGGRAVVLLTNAPRPGAVVARQLGAMGLPAEAFDAVVASGDVTRAEIARHAAAAGGTGPLPVLHIGPDRDLPTFENLPAARVGEDDARLVVCTGLAHDEVETPETYRPLLERLAARGLPMVCANPDRLVERGPRLIPCAGALADVYEALGGSVVWAGKPHAPAYRAAFAAGVASGASGEVPRALAVGDAVATDLAGAAGAGVDALFVERGLHHAEIAPDGRADPSRVEALLSVLPRKPVARIVALRW